jgi:nitrogen regulatory protein PII
MRKIETVITAAAVDTIMRSLAAQGCGQVALSKLERASEYLVNTPVVRLEIIVGDDKALATVHTILFALPGQPGEGVDSARDPERVIAVAIWSVTDSVTWREARA